MSQQNYEAYWTLTNAYTNYNGFKFNQALEICIDFIDAGNGKDEYDELQNILQRAQGTNLISIRKKINQLVKLGFIDSSLTFYHPNCSDYINANNDTVRNTLLSKIVYSKSSLTSSVTESSSLHQINFLIKTLEQVGQLSKSEIIALMIVDITDYPDGFVTRREIDYYINLANEDDFIQRKYNQVGHFINLLGKLDNLTYQNETLFFAKDPRIETEIETTITIGRDQYLHRLYKNQLQEECIGIYGNPKCVLERLSYPVLIASHIKPFIESEENEAYDPNNGLLLSRTIDSLFDLKYISFENNGDMIFSNRISKDVKEFWKDYKLENTILNEERKNYLAYHRNLVIERDARA
jgi:hypothetical protein